MNAIVTQVENGNAIVMLLKECLHKCLVSGDAGGDAGCVRGWALFTVWST